MQTLFLSNPIIKELLFNLERGNAPSRLEFEREQCPRNVVRFLFRDGNTSHLQVGGTDAQFKRWWAEAAFVIRAIRQMEALDDDLNL